MPPLAVVEECARCRRAFGHRPAYWFQTPGGWTGRCLRCALRYPPMIRRSTVIAVVVGTALTAINHGDTLLAGSWPPALLWKLPMTYAVPFIVATLGALGTGRSPKRP